MFQLGLHNCVQILPCVRFTTNLRNTLENERKSIKKDRRMKGNEKIKATENVIRKTFLYKFSYYIIFYFKCMKRSETLDNMRMVPTNNLHVHVTCICKLIPQTSRQHLFLMKKLQLWCNSVEGNCFSYQSNIILLGKHFTFHTPVFQFNVNSFEQMCLEI